MSTSQELLARLRAEGADLPPCTELRRTYRNRQTGIGAWSWFAYCPLAGGRMHPDHTTHMNLHYGSHWPMRMLLAARGFTFQKLECGDICVDPAVPEQEK